MNGQDVTIAARVTGSGGPNLPVQVYAVRPEMAPTMLAALRRARPMW
jgi:hypothetical protein